MEKYFLILNSDGDTIVEEYTKEELEKELNEWVEDSKDPSSIKFLNHIDDKDTNYWGRNMLLIKGEIITPKAKEVVIKFSL